MEAKFELAKEMIIILLGMIGFSEPSSRISIQEELTSLPGYRVTRTYTADVTKDGYFVFFGEGDSRISMMAVTRGDSDYSFIVSEFAESENKKDQASIRAEIDLTKLFPTVEFEKFIAGGEVSIDDEEETFKITKNEGNLVLTSPDAEVFTFSIEQE
ncbi:MAG: hypothetical protein ACSHYB_18650 [Roseibacillus sp.]